MERKTNPIAVVGAGSWGTTLAMLLAEKGYPVRLWVRAPALCKEIFEKRENTAYLKGVFLPPNIRPTTSLGDAVKDAHYVVSSIPSHGIREVFKDISPYMGKSSVIVSTSKGIEEGTLLTPSGILMETLPGRLHKNIVVLSGPTFAKEVSRHLLAAACVGAASMENALNVQDAFSTPFLRLYTSDDPLGLELGGALKNVIAIASGISDGLGLGMNARAALITRGLREITRLGERMGAKKETFYGLSGIGDMVLTCTGALSRNYTVGFEIGKGRFLKEILSSMSMVAEGVKTSMAARGLARKFSIEMPITEAVYKVIYEDKAPNAAVTELMTRELKMER